MNQSAESISSTESQADVYYLGDRRLEISLPERIVLADSESIHVTTTDFDLLVALAKRAGSVVPGPELCYEAWGYDDTSSYFSTANIRASIARLRARLGPELGDCKTGIIRTRFALGYYGAYSLKDPTRTLESCAEELHQAVDARLKVYTKSQVATCDDKPLALTPTEFKIVNLMIQRVGQTTSNLIISKNAREVDKPSTRDDVRIHIKNIRRKLGLELGDAENGAIVNEPGVGYYIRRSLGQLSTAR